MKTKCFLHLMRSALNWSFSFVKYEKNHGHRFNEQMYSTIHSRKWFSNIHAVIVMEVEEQKKI